MQRVERDTPLPTEMQGRWVGVDEPTSELIIEGGKITCFGQPVAYDYKEVSREDGAIAVNLRVDDPANEDAFERANITGLVITPDGDFHAFNVKFGIQFARSV